VIVIRGVVLLPTSFSDLLEPVIFTLPHSTVLVFQAIAKPHDSGRRPAQQ